MGVIVGIRARAVRRMEKHRTMYKLQIDCSIFLLVLVFDHFLISFGIRHVASWPWGL